MGRVVVIGGGISGLALAYRLRRRLPSAEVLVLEERDRTGGTVRTVARDGFRLEAGPNGFLDNKPGTMELSRELGLGERLQPASEASARNRYLFLGGRLRALPAGFLSFLRSDLLSWVGKLSLLLERFRPRRRGDGDESIASFARRRAGDEVARTLADAFVTGIYAGDPRQLSAQACFPRLTAFEREHGSVMAGLAHARRERRARGEQAPGRPGGQMWSFREGLGALIEALTAALPGSVLTGVPVRRALRGPAGWRVEAQGRDAWGADAVALACPAHRQAEIVADAAPELAQTVGAIPYNRVAVVGLGYRAADVPFDLNGFGYLSPQRERRDVLGVQWCSSIFPGRSPPGTVLLRAMCGGANRPEIVDWPDERLLSAVRAELHAALRVHAAPVFHHVVRWQRAIPQYHVGHLDRVARAERLAEAQPGLFLAGNAYHGVALNDCVEQSGRVAERIATWLEAGPGRNPS
jgi:oxygen-dependent protoporphyrinogen oxidase